MRSALAGFLPRAPLLVMLAVYPAAAQTLSPQEVFRRVAPSVVVIEVKDYPETGNSKLIGSGSGVVVPSESKDRNKIVTNCHVVDNAKNGVVEIVQGEKLGVGFLSGRDKARDLCVIDALVYKSLPNGNVDVGNGDGLQLPPAQISSSTRLEVGDAVYAVGAPQGLELSLSNGLVSGFREYEGSEYIQTTAPISKGSSGGGLFDAQGRLVGITTMYVKDGQALNFAVPAQLIASVPKVNSSSKGGRRPNASVVDPGQAADAAAAAQASAEAAQISADAAAMAADAAVAAAEEESLRRPKDRWWTFYEDKERAIAFDTETVSKDGRVITVWERTRFARPQQSASGKTYVEDIIRATFYCGSRQSSFDQITSRDTNGLVVESVQLKIWQVDRQNLMPETIGETKYEAACES